MRRIKTLRKKLVIKKRKRLSAVVSINNGCIVNKKRLYFFKRQLKKLKRRKKFIKSIKSIKKKLKLLHIYLKKKKTKKFNRKHLITRRKYVKRGSIVGSFKPVGELISRPNKSKKKISKKKKLKIYVPKKINFRLKKLFFNRFRVCGTQRFFFVKFRLNKSSFKKKKLKKKKVNFLRRRRRYRRIGKFYIKKDLLGYIYCCDRKNKFFFKKQNFFLLRHSRTFKIDKNRHVSYNKEKKLKMRRFIRLYYLRRDNFYKRKNLLKYNYQYENLYFYWRKNNSC